MKKELFISNYKQAELSQEYIQKDGLYFYYGPDLKVTIGNMYIFFGDVFNYNYKHGIQQGMELMDHENLTVDEIERMLYYWGGRFVLYYNKRFYMDCSGLLGLFYYNEGNKWYISSSLKLLSQNIGIRIIDDAPIFQWGQFLNYFPLPKTMLERVYKLGNYEGLKIMEHGGIKPFVRRLYNGVEIKEVNALCEDIKDAFGCFVKDLKGTYGNHIALELTGGVDSRTNLALLLANGCKPAVYSHYVPHFNRYDMSVPKKISHMYDLKYVFCGEKTMQKFSEDKLEEYDQQVCFSVADGDRYTYSHGLNIFSQDWVVLRSGIFESTRYYYDHFFESFEGKKEFLAQLNSMNHGLNKNVLLSLELWLDNFDNDEVYKCSKFLNKFYKEQRNGAWTSYIELGNELKNFTIIQPANCSYFIDLLQAFPEEMRNNNTYQKYLIYKIDKRLAKIPYNFSIYSSGKAKLKTIIKKIL